MVKKQKTRNWHNPAKEVQHGTNGKCAICKKEVKNLEAHMKKVHREKIIQ